VLAGLPASSAAKLATSQPPGWPPITRSASESL